MFTTTTLNTVSNPATNAGFAVPEISVVELVAATPGYQTWLDQGEVGS